MKSTIGLLALAALLLWGSAGFAETPHQLAGIRLGSNVDEYKDLLQQDTILPVRHMEYLSEVQLNPIEGYRSGYITFGNCAAPGEIVKIKLNYAQDDEAFFNSLLDAFKKAFGEPCEYRGDAFRAFIAWKWSFKDAQGNRISLTLQRNSAGDEDYTQGNSVKISAGSLIEREGACYEKKHPESAASPAAGKASTLSIEHFLPK